MRSWATALSALGVLVVGCADDPGADSDTSADPTVPWATADCGFDPADTGWEVGDVLPDFSLTNQHGSQTHLHQFCDRYVLIQVTNYW